MSADHLTFCYMDCGFGCGGEYTIGGWWYFSTQGVVSGGGYNTSDVNTNNKDVTTIKAIIVC